MKALIFTFTLLFSLPALAGSLEEGIKKYEAGSYKEAYEIIRQFEGTENLLATEYLAHLYWNGAGVEKNLQKGCNYFEAVANTDNAEALSHLGMCYLDGGGREPDLKKAYDLLRKASDLGYKGNLKLEASVAFQIGEYPSAFGYYVAASADGDFHAMITLGVMYRDGLYPKQNHEKACDLFEKALPSKYTTALHNFGDCLYFGLGRPIDKKGAYPYFKEAAEMGSEKSKAAAEAIYKELYGAKSQ